MSDPQTRFAEKVRALQSPAAYPHAAQGIELIETHFACVFLVGEYAYKLKKPVCIDTMDLRQLEARYWSCQEELRLNARLAPGVYLDVLPLIRELDGSMHVGGEGDVVDWVVRMRRLPAELMLDRALASGSFPESALDALGVMLARFYAEQPAIKFDAHQYASRIAQQIHADRRALSAPELGLDGELLQRALKAQWCAFAAREEELGRRALEDRIVEAHGDLRPEHVYLGDPPCVIDSLEFSKELRTLDPAEELAFLWVECEHAGDVRPAERVLASYRKASADPVSDRLLDFYRSRRALVRAKLVAWHLYDPAVASLAPWGDRAEIYMERAEQYARRALADDACDERRADLMPEKLRGSQSYAPPAVPPNRS